MAILQKKSPGKEAARPCLHRQSAVPSGTIIIPCHRVVGADGSLTGYAGGIDKKVKLLKLEQTDMTQLYIPNKGTAL